MRQRRYRRFPRVPDGRSVIRAIGGCTCWGRSAKLRSTHTFETGPDSPCDYHAYAAQHPDDHRSPWNCPTYWDGCNCEDRQ